MDKGQDIGPDVARLESLAAVTGTGDQLVINPGFRVGGNPSLAQPFGLQVGYNRIGIAMPDQDRRQGFAQKVKLGQRACRAGRVAFLADGKAKQTAFRAFRFIRRATGRVAPSTS